MNRLITLVGTAVVAGVVWVSPAEAQPRGAALGAEGRAPHMAAAPSPGFIEGAVVDERGWPLPGVMVSALGATTALAVTDRSGAFRLQQLPPGGYLVRAHLAGFSPSRRELVQVGAGRGSRFSVTLRRSETPDEAPPLLAAGIGPTGDGADTVETEADASEKTWRLRHLRRSVLKETTERVALAAEEPSEGNAFSVVTRALDSSAQFLADLPLTAEVNFLTSGSFDGSGAGFTGASSMRRTAYVSIGGTAFRGDWSGQVMTQGDLGSWFVAGNYRKQAPASHLFDVGISYSTQRFTAPARWPLSAESDGTRSSGAIYAVDRWTISPAVTLSYGGRYARYDYLEEGLFSPHANLILEPAKGLRFVGSASRRLLAPGAEEFLAPLDTGLWLPPEHTFIGEPAIAPESTSHFEIGMERDLWREVVFAVRAFVQQTRHQQVALFGDAGIRPQPTGHYEVADFGNLDARGWSIGVSGSPWSSLRGSLLYSMTDASWFPSPASGEGLILVGLAPRTGRERLHDLTGSVEAEFPTATTVLVAYRLNSGFARRSGDAVEPAFGGRYEVRLIQSLPFLDFTSARWQALVAVRNMFRDTTADASVYDELLVVRPPKRVVGGLLVRF
jgi:hypothetical protein